MFLSKLISLTLTCQILFLLLFMNITYYDFFMFIVYMYNTFYLKLSKFFFNIKYFIKRIIKIDISKIFLDNFH